MVYHNGTSYSGRWEKGKQHGRGTFTFAQGDNYSGEWEAGKMHGKGTLTKSG
jgi:hypothetical protein